MLVEDIQKESCIVSTLKMTVLQQSAIQDNVRSAGLLKFSSGILMFVITLALIHYLAETVIGVPEGLTAFFFALPFYSLPLFYAFAGFVELISGEPFTYLPHRWIRYSIAQRRFIIVVVVSFMSLIAISLV